MKSVFLTMCNWTLNESFFPPLTKSNNCLKLFRFTTTSTERNVGGETSASIALNIGSKGMFGFIKALISIW